MIVRTDRLKLFDNKIARKYTRLIAKNVIRNREKVFIFLYSYMYLLLCTLSVLNIFRQ